MLEPRVNVLEALAKLALPPTEHENFYSEFEDDLDEDDLDQFEQGENFEDYGFEENWN